MERERERAEKMIIKENPKMNIKDFALKCLVEFILNLEGEMCSQCTQ